MADFFKKVKLTELENKIPEVSSLATNTALTAGENKILSSLIEKTDYDTKITEIEKKLADHNHDKYITTLEFNALAADVFYARLVRANLLTKQTLMLNCRVLTEKLMQINKKLCLLKMS